MIDRLAAALPEHSVFDSGGSAKATWVTIMPVVAQWRVLERRTEVLRAIADYQRACATLVALYQAGTLPEEWSVAQHGGHYRFASSLTGQVVEAPFGAWLVAERVDPYFFAEFVKTTAGLESVALLIEDNFHDGLRILDLVAPKG
jgi:hypothetical protein